MRFAGALERACAQHGVARTYQISEAQLDAWAEEELTLTDAGVELDTIWKEALRVAEAATWRDYPKPAGATFTVRVTELLTLDNYSANDVPF